MLQVASVHTRGKLSHYKRNPDNAAMIPANMSVNGTVQFMPQADDTTLDPSGQTYSALEKLERDKMEQLLARVDKLEILAEDDDFHGKQKWS